MQLPSILQGDSLTRLIQGVVVGSLLTMIIGFWPGGWVLGGTAQKMVETQTRELRGKLCAARYLAKFGPTEAAALAKANYSVQAEKIDASKLALDDKGKTDWDARRDCISGIEKLVAAAGKTAAK